jgi:non-ribosomal peptide synthetase component E (peptide arylation enzyme)
MAPPIETFPYSGYPEKFNIATHFLDTPAALHPERLVIVGEPREVSYGELALLANRVGSALRAQGVSRGDRALIVLPDSVAFVEPFFCTSKC